jgi:hypothetical protein
VKSTLAKFCNQFSWSASGYPEILLQPLLFPRTSQTARARSTPDAGQTNRGSGETILVVEDNKALLDAIMDALQQGIVSGEEAFLKATDKNRFKQFMPAGAPAH